MKIVFMGTGEIAEPAFLALQQSQHNLCALVTQPDKPVGRKQLLTPPPIKLLAQQASIPVFQPKKIRESAFIEQLKELKADLFVVMAYGQILPTSILSMPSIACINLHASLLPKHRGASCIQAALLAGDAVTGITAMHMTEGLDEGDIICTDSLDIQEKETGGELHDRLAQIAPCTLLKALDLLEKNKAPRQPQEEHLANYAPKLLRSDGEIDWQESALTIERKIRAYAPWPGTFTTWQDVKGKTKRLKIFPPVSIVDNLSQKLGELIVQKEEGKKPSLFIQTGEGALQLFQVQPEGKKPLSAADFIRGNVEN